MTFHPPAFTRSCGVGACLFGRLSCWCSHSNLPIASLQNKRRGEANEEMRVKSLEHNVKPFCALNDSGNCAIPSIHILNWWQSSFETLLKGVFIWSLLSFIFSHLYKCKWSPPGDKNTYLVGGDDSLRHTFDHLSFSMLA